MIRYAVAIKSARLAVVRDALNGGAIEILSAAGSRLAIVDLEPMSGHVVGGVLKLSDFPRFAMAEGSGVAAAARLLDSPGKVVGDGLTVGAKDADIILDNINIEAGNVVKIVEAEIA